MICILLRYYDFIESIIGPLQTKYKPMTLSQNSNASLWRCDFLKIIIGVIAALLYGDATLRSSIMISVLFIWVDKNRKHKSFMKR